MISSEEALREPLTTDTLIEKRVADLIGRANRRQLWVLFIGDHDLQLPDLIAIDDLPTTPPPLGPGEALRMAVDQAGASSIILVWERWSDASLTPADRAWISHLTNSCAESGLAVRAVLLSHRDGVRWVARDDWPV